MRIYMIRARFFQFSKVTAGPYSFFQGKKTQLAGRPHKKASLLSEPGKGQFSCIGVSHARKKALLNRAFTSIVASRSSSDPSFVNKVLNVY